MAESYYSARSARDPAWRQAQIAGAMERERRRRELDPEGVRAARREATRRSRARQRAHGFTFEELLLRVGGDPETLAALRSLSPPEPNGSQPPSGRRARLDQSAGAIASAWPDILAVPTKPRASAAWRAR